MDVQPINQQSIWIIRHGERIDDVDADWVDTAEFIYDPPLTERGHKQARLTGMKLLSESTNISFIFSSPFQRCISTALEISQIIQVPVLIEDGLSEVLTRSVVSSQPALLWHKKKDFLNSIRVNSELLDTNGFHTSVHSMPRFPEEWPGYKSRYKNTLNSILQAPQYQGKNMVFVTHGLGVKCLIYSFFPGTYPSYTDYCCVSKFTKSFPAIDRWRIDYLVDTSHWQPKFYL